MVSRSEPNDRDIATRSARPSAASQAPRARNRNIRSVLFNVVAEWFSTVKPTIVSRTLSAARSTIRKRVRCERNRTSAVITGRGRNIRVEGHIVSGQGLSLIYKINAIY